MGDCQEGLSRRALVRCNVEAPGIDGRIDDAAFPTIAFLDALLDISGIGDEVCYALRRLIVPATQTLSKRLQCMSADRSRRAPIRLIALPDISHRGMAIANVRCSPAANALYRRRIGTEDQIISGEIKSLGRNWKERQVVPVPFGGSWKTLKQ